MMPQSSVFIVRHCGKINKEIYCVHEIFHSVIVHTFQTLFGRRFENINANTQGLLCLVIRTFFEMFNILNRIIPRQN